tara:strand:+ start:4429 stop:5187 length:759 start_codon:yes stop_codon:yes gene_type:complete
MSDIISSAKRLGRSNRSMSRAKTKRALNKNIANDLSATLAQLAGFADQKAIESENLQAGESLLKEGDNFQKIKDTKEFSWKDPKSWGKQEGYRYNDKIYDKEQVMTLGESFKTYGSGFDDKQKSNLMSNWEEMNKDKSSSYVEPSSNSPMINMEDVVKKHKMKSSEKIDNLINNTFKEEDSSWSFLGDGKGITNESIVREPSEKSKDNIPKIEKGSNLINNITTSVNNELLSSDDQAWVNEEFDDNRPFLKY